MIHWKGFGRTWDGIIEVLSLHLSGDWGKPWESQSSHCQDTSIENLLNTRTEHYHYTIPFRASFGGNSEKGCFHWKNNQIILCLCMVSGQIHLSLFKPSLARWYGDPILSLALSQLICLQYCYHVQPPPIADYFCTMRISHPGYHIYITYSWDPRAFHPVQSQTLITDPPPIQCLDPFNP
jgi:hypothetical protein